MTENGRSRARVRIWGEAGAGLSSHDAVPGRLSILDRQASVLIDRLGSWASAEVGPGRLLPWTPVLFGLGIVFYFTADREPHLWAALLVVVAGLASAVLCRARPYAFAGAVAVMAAAAGLAAATFKSERVRHPVLTAPVSASLSGYIEIREERERSDRIVLRVERIETARQNVKVSRVRLSVRKSGAPPVGTFVSLKARLNPPLQPLRPGGYDFARDLYFQGIGATGFVLGKISITPAIAPPDFWLTARSVISGMRDAIDMRIRSVAGGDLGSIASALITGKRDAISTQVNEAMYISSLAHVLSISGYHMAVVAGIVFFVLRALLALIPALASRYPIKKFAALAALVAAAFYLLLSGAEVATQRSFIMTAVVLIGVIFDRPALTLRTIAVAAVVVMLIAPEAVVHPSFQMSFAATLALIAAYERGLSWFSAVPETAFAARVAMWGGREVIGLIVVSLVAGFATSIYAAYHFHRFAPYGVLANLLAMPVISVWVMPAGILGLIAIPFGFDSLLWSLMSAGIEWVVAIALWITNLPGAVGRIAAFDVGPLLMATAGLLVLCLLRTPLRFVGALFFAVAFVWIAAKPKPDILIAADGRAVALRLQDGQLAVMKDGGDDFTIREWLAADADTRGAKDPSLTEGINCDETGCVGRLADRGSIALSHQIESLAEDCQRSTIVVSMHGVVLDCAARLIGRDELRRYGAMALYRKGEDFSAVHTRPSGHQRPWTPSVTPAAPAGSPTSISVDATPRAEDREIGD